MLLWATKAQFSTGPNWASLSFFFLFVYFCLTAAPGAQRRGAFVCLGERAARSLQEPPQLCVRSVDPVGGKQPFPGDAVLPRAFSFPGFTFGGQG